ncbi:protein MAIN-LIKE 1-like [Lathyrus oleraceus]|uniref:protein MAIN-LIKE 1-like n=1 Tax=Pisum sativum TaxID=3888 RepID=UPI0021CEA6FF|nr:protein MAIN-LIKE 1-like [Pisum sativum]
MYLDHIVRHIWDREDRNPLKIINHGRKITGLPRSNEKCFQAALSLSGMKDLCMTGYMTVNHGILNAFLEIWHIETSSFHLPLGEMSITLDDVLCLLHLPVGGKRLGHGRISKDKELELMVDNLGVDLEVVLTEMERTRGAHARFELLKKLYTYELLRAEQARGDEE